MLPSQECIRVSSEFMLDATDHKNKISSAVKPKTELGMTITKAFQATAFSAI